MHARLGPQAPDVEELCAAIAQEAYPGPSAALLIEDWPPYPPIQQTGWDMTSRGPPSFISRRMGDMLSMPFSSHIINYEPLREFIVPKIFA